jgi:hypothetical protein
MLVENPMLQAKIKYIEIKHHFIWKRSRIEAVEACYIPTFIQQVDFWQKH